MNDLASPFRLDSESEVERDLLDQVRALQPYLAEQAAQTEANGRVSEQTTKKFVDAGLYRLNQSKRWGGFDLPPSSTFRLGYEVGRVCPSTAWCAIIANSMSWIVGYWPEEAQADVWGQNPGTVIAGTFSPTASCQKVDGGYEVTGKWPFASNCDNSDWVFVSSWFPEGGERGGEPGWFLVPRHEVNIDPDSWNVTGMQGTGSKTLYANADAPLRIPEHRAIHFMDIVNDCTPGLKIEGNMPPRFNFATFGCVFLLAPIMGAAQGMVDWYVEAMKKKIKVSFDPNAKAAVSENTDAQRRAGESQACLDAAVSLVLTDLRPLEKKIMAGEMLTQDERIRIRRSVGFAAQQGRAVANSIFEGAGASSTSLNVPLQRLWRDINMGANHTSLDVGGIYRMAGQQIFGLPPVGAF